MNFLTPLALTFAALSIPIILLYMLKLRRRDVLVSSTLLWQRLLRDREANAPWQRLRRNLLLLLQLLALTLLTLALARPFLPTPAVVSGSVVILVDSSASMRARDVEPTRFDAARNAAREIIAGLGAGDAVTLIAVGPQPRVLASATTDRALLHRALDEAAPTAGSADWEAAFALAAAGLTGAADTQVVIVSDGALPETLPPLPGQVRYMGVGGGSDNVAITALATRAGEAGPQAFLRVVNYSDADVETLIEFSTDGVPSEWPFQKDGVPSEWPFQKDGVPSEWPFQKDGVLFDARRLLVPAHDSASLTLADLPYDLRLLQARLTLEDENENEDALPLDDVAWTIHAPPASGQVLLVSAGNLFLERALGALPSVELVRLSPDQPVPEEDYALYVYDSAAIADGAITTTLPSGNLWLIGPAASVGGDFPIEVRDTFTATAITHVAADDPLLRYVDLSDVNILQARKVKPPPGAQVLVEAEGGPLLFVAERPEGRLVVLTFDLRDSDLPLQIAFPILAANLTNWLLPRGELPLLAGEGLGEVRPGDPVPIQPDPEAAKIVVTAPDGARHVLLVGETIPVFASTDQLGIYLVEQLDRSDTVLQSVVLAVNLFDEAESDIAPRETVRIGQTEITAAAQEEEGRREFWPWLAVAALGVLVVEWWVYQRGTLRLGQGEG
ncbi:MAG: BatA and WFA domain-containing protein [Chloroflexota bacterium]|nr:BatA and WFA domain-containing protein [Chloroflexota bacterium]